MVGAIPGHRSRHHTVCCAAGRVDIKLAIVNLITMPAAQLLTPLQHLLMLAALRLGDDASGAALQRDVERAANRRLSIATIYVTMDRLEDQGLVRSWLGNPTPARGGKARRHYAVTARGAKALVQARDELRRAWDGLESHPAFGRR